MEDVKARDVRQGGEATATGRSALQPKTPPLESRARAESSSEKEEHHKSLRRASGSDKAVKPPPGDICTPVPDGTLLPPGICSPVPGWNSPPPWLGTPVPQVIRKVAGFCLPRCYFCKCFLSWTIIPFLFFTVALSTLGLSLPLHGGCPLYMAY
jgi:hypothetical protein